MPNNLFQNLPQGWEVKTLGEACEILDNMRKPINAEEREKRLVQATNKFPYYGATGQVGYIDDYLCDFESILLGEDGAPFLEPFKNKAYIVNGKYWVNNHAHILKAQENIAINKFICYFLNILDYMPYVSGTTRLKLNQSSMRQIQIPLPPLETQQKIVAKLESEFAKIESAKSHLEKVKETIPRLKNSLLKSAFNGELTQSCKDKKGVPYRHCEDSSESEAIYNAESPLKDSIAESKACKIVDCHELRCNSRNDENTARIPSSTQAPNLGGATLVARNLQNGTNPLHCHLEHGEETHKESSCHSEALAEESQNIKPHKDSTLKDISATPQYDKTTLICHADLECNERKESHIIDSSKDISHFSNAQYDNVDSCHSESPLCHSERSEESKSHFANAQYEKDSNLPQGWEVKTLGEVSKINPKNKLDDDLEVSFIPMNLIADKYQNKFSYTIKTWKEVKKGYTHLQNNCIAIAKITPCFENGKCVILQDLKNGYGAGTTKLIVILPNENIILLKFIFYFFNTAKFTKEGVKNFKGTAGQLRVSSDFISNLPIPLPPLETQKQIVEILDSKFAALENLERETNASLEKLQRLKSSLLNLTFKGELIC